MASQRTFIFRNRPQCKQAVEILRLSGVQFVSAGIVQFALSVIPCRQACLVKDPDGHAMLLIEK